jgi:cytoskeletal protein RodZ
MSIDGDAQETRRNRTIAIGVAVAAVAMVGLLFWIFNSLSGPALAVSPTAVTTTTGTTATDAPAPNDTTSIEPPSVATWTPSTTFSLPPPEQPTETVAAQPAEQPSAPPSTQAAPPPPPKPGISNVNLTCSKGDGRRVTGRLTFSTTAKVDVILSAGSQLDRKSEGPGNVSMTTSGRGAEICFARVGDQTVGPVPAT